MFERKTAQEALEGLGEALLKASQAFVKLGKALAEEDKEEEEDW